MKQEEKLQSRHTIFEIRNPSMPLRNSIRTLNPMSLRYTDLATLEERGLDSSINAGAQCKQREKTVQSVEGSPREEINQKNKQ